MSKDFDSSSLSSRTFGTASQAKASDVVHTSYVVMALKMVFLLFVSLWLATGIIPFTRGWCDGARLDVMPLTKLVVRPITSSEATWGIWPQPKCRCWPTPRTLKIWVKHATRKGTETDASVLSESRAPCLHWQSWYLVDLCPLPLPLPSSRRVLGAGICTQRAQWACIFVVLVSVIIDAAGPLEVTCRAAGAGGSAAGGGRYAWPRWQLWRAMFRERSRCCDYPALSFVFFPEARPWSSPERSRTLLLLSSWSLPPGAVSRVSSMELSRSVSRRRLLSREDDELRRLRERDCLRRTASKNSLHEAPCFR